MAEKGFFGALFDISFSEFITVRLIKVLFVIAIIGSAIGAVTILIGGIASGGGAAFLSIIMAPIAFFLYVLMARVWLELILVMFRISDNVDKLAEQKSTEQSQG